MKRQILLSLSLCSALLGTALGYGTTISIAVSYCPATYTSSRTLPSSTTTAYPTSSSSTSEPFYLSFLVDPVLPRRADEGFAQNRRYIIADGGVTEDPRGATAFLITSSGQLMSDGGYISTTGEEDGQQFKVSPELRAISTRFSVRPNDILSWENDLFVEGEAIFCLLGNLFVIFDGTLPSGCARTYLNVIPTDQVDIPPTSTFTTTFVAPQSTTSLTYVTSTATPTTTSVPSYPPDTVYGSLVYAIPLGCLSSPSNNPALLGPNTFVSRLEQCADYCFDFDFFGVQSGSFCVCGNAIQSTEQGICDVPCVGNTTTICGGANAVSAYEVVFRQSGSESTTTTIPSVISSTNNPTLTTTTSSIVVDTTSFSNSYTSSTRIAGESSPSSTTSSTSTSDFPAPTSTGTPNCFDGSGFDGTVNSNYLILCDTGLPGSDLDSVPAADIAECIEACNSYVPTLEGICIAVEFDILAEENPCHLKFSIGIVTRGGNPFSQAAIVVNQPNAPDITFSGDPGFSTTTSVYIESTTTIPPVPTTTQTPALTSTSLATTMTTSSSPVVLSTVSPTPSQPLTTTNTGVPPTDAQSSSIPSTSVSPSTQSVSSSITSQQPTPSTTAPNSLSTIRASGETTGAPQPSSSSPSAAGTPTTIVASSTLAIPGSSFTSTTASSAFPNTSGTTLGVTSGPPGTTTSSATSRTSTTTPPSMTSGPLGTSPSSVTSTIPQSTLSTSSRPIATTVTTLSTTNLPTTTLTTTTTRAPFCSGATPTAALCPTYNHQAVNVNGDGACYEIECQTTLDGTILTANSTRAVSHNACIGFCSLYNLALPFGCIGINYFGTSVPGNNCVLLSNITGTRYAPGVDSGRLLYAGYPSINDPNYGTISISSVSQTATPTQTSLISTTTYVPLNCPAGPTSASSPLCPGNSPFCYSFNSWGTPNNFEIECATSFTGSSLQPLLAFSLADCISWCQYANAYSTSLCTGVTFREGNITQGGMNNCFRYTSLTCATRGNATFNSARILNDAYQQMTDYSDPNFICSAQTSSTLAAGTSTVPGPGASSSTSRPATTTSPAATVSTSRPATSTTADLSQATSTDFPSAYPQDPVCENNLISKFEGGQALVNPSLGRYYDIECAADYNNPGNNPYGVTIQPTYNSCLNQCDLAANASGVATSCAAFSWVSSSGACTLFGRVSNGRQTTTNMTNTLGTHSGRYLYNNGGGVPDGPGLQLYLQRPIPFPTGQNVVGATLPAFPGGTNTYFNGWAANAHTTPLDLSQLGIQWRIFGQTSNKLFVSANFWLTTTQLELNSSSQNTWSVGGRNNDATPIAFPASNLPPYTIAPFWTQGFILMAGQQGIYYQVDTISPGRYGISIEWYFSHFQINNAVQHAIMTYDTLFPGVWTTYFFRAGSTTDDQGKRQTVGGQGSSSIFGQSFNYCQGQANCITPGSKLVFNTAVSDFSATATYNASYFAPNNVPFGSWTWTNRPV